MNQVLKLRNWVFGVIALVAAAPAFAASDGCCGDSSTAQGVPIQIYVFGCVDGTTSFDLAGRGIDGGSEEIASLTETDNAFDSAQANATLVVDASYTLSTTNDSGTTATTHVGIVAPPGYTVEINGKKQNGLDQIDEGTLSSTVVIRSTMGGSTPGQAAEPRLGSATWGVDIGAMPNGESAGRIMLREPELTADSYTRAQLIYSAPADAGNDFVTVTRDGNGDLEKIVTDLAVVELTDLTSPTGVQIAFYENDGTGSKTGSAYTVWQITDTSPGGSPNTKIKFEKTTGGTASSDTYEVTYSGGGTNYSWTMVTGDGTGSDPDLRKVVRTTTISGAQSEIRTDVEEIKDTNDTVLRKTTYVYETFGWGEEMIEQIIDPDGEALTTKWEYYETDTEVGRYANLKSVEYEDGRWVKYDYYYSTDVQGLVDALNTPGDNTADSLALSRLGQLKQELRSWNDQALSGATEDNAYSIDYDWEPLHKNTSFNNPYSLHADQLISEEHYVPTGTSRTQIENRVIDLEYIRGSEGLTNVGIPAYGILYKDTRYLDPDNVSDAGQSILTQRLISREDSFDVDVASLPGSVNIVSWTVDPDTAGKPLWEKSDDGRMTVYQYEPGTYTDSGAASAASFSASGDDGSFRVSMVQGVELTAAPGGGDTVEYPNDDLETAADYQNAVKLIADHSTKTTSVYDAYGRMAMSEMYTWDGTVWTRRSWTVTRYNIEGQATSRYFHDGTSSSTAYGSDDRVESMTDRRGLKTEYGYDEAGRRNTTTHYADVDSSGDVSTGDIILRETKSTYDASGRSIKTERKPDGGSYYTVSETEYDDAGRTSMRKDALGKLMFYTYNDVKADGSDYDHSTDTGPWFNERRVYPHDKDSGAVRVTWSDNNGSTVRQWSGTSTATWSEASPPSGGEALTEVARSTMAYEAPGRVSTSWSYFDLASLALNQDGTKGTNYYESEVLAYDMVGRALRSKSAIGDITASVYDGQRIIEAWHGLDDTGATIDDPSGGGSGSNDMVQIARQFYDSDRDGTGDELGYVTRSQTLKPVTTDPPTFSTSNTATDFEQTYTASGMESWTKPELGPWSKQITDYQGRSIESVSYQNGSTSYVLTKSTSHYDDANTRPWRMTASRVHEVNGSGGTTGNYLESTFGYDDAERQVKSASTAGGFTKTAFDDENRVERRIFASDEGSNADADAFTDDIVLTESVPTYDTLGNVVKTVTYERNHDAPGTTTGLLSSNTSDARINTSLTWYDDAHRPTYQVVFGTGTPSASYDDPTTDTAPEPNTSDDYLVTKYEYDAEGMRYQTTDNLGRKSRVEFDDMGRTTKVIENYVDGSPLDANPDEDRVTTYTYNAAGQTIEQTADLEGSSNDQTTQYIYSSELTDKGSPVKSNTLLRAIIMPDSDDTVTANALANGTDATYDRVELTYMANGQLATRKDQREVVLTSTYDAIGRPIEQGVTSGTVDGDQQWKTTYTDLSQPSKVTAYSDAGTTISSEIEYAYNGYQQTATEYQEHGGAVNTSTSHKIQFAYDTTSSGDVHTKGHRLDTITYPNGRVIQRNYDGHNGIDDAISRANAIEEDSSGNDIVSYSYLGSGRMVRKEYPTPSVRLDMLDEPNESGDTDANADYDLSWDAFGRPIRYQWETYDYLDLGEDDLVHLAHGYDRNSNRLYDERKADNGMSKLYERDDLDRITGNYRGVLTDDGGTKDTYFNRLKGIYDLDALGNPTEIDYKGATPYVKNITHNDANELDTREVYEKAASAVVNDGFGSDTKADWDIPGSDDFSITGGYLQPTTVSADTIDGTLESDPHALFLWGPKLGPVANETYFTFDASITTTARAGFVFGYEDAHNYWIVVLKYVPGGQSKKEICQVVDGVLTVLKSANTTINTGTEYSTHIGSTRNHIRNNGQQHDFSTGYPAGRIGIYTDNADVKFNKFMVWPKDAPSDLAGRWDRYSSADSASDGIGVYNTDIKRYYPTLLRGVTTPASEPWRTTFKMKRSAATRNRDGLRFLFNVRDHDTYSRLAIQHAATAQDVSGSEWLEGADDTYSAGTATSANVPAIASSGTPMWAHIEYDGTDTVTVKLSEGTTEPTDWSSVGVAYTSTGFNMTGGGIGFHAYYGAATVKYVRVETDANADGTFVTEYEDTMGGWATYEPVEHEHDAAGNLTYDGEKQYTYDAFNRLVKVNNAYRDDNDDIQPGSVIAEYGYDGNNRRIRKDTYLGGVLESVEHFYYHGQSLVETRNGSDQVIQQHVWDNLAGHYIDSLAQVIKKAGPTEFIDHQYYPLQDQQFNILAIVDDQGTLVERYEYSLYGKRQIINAQGVMIGSSAYDMQMGFQGLYHDDESRLIYNRARMLIPALDRFLQRDPLGYPDGMNTYAAYHVIRGGLDPFGRQEAVAYHRVPNGCGGPYCEIIYDDGTVGYEDFDWPMSANLPEWGVYQAQLGDTSSNGSGDATSCCGPRIGSWLIDKINTNAQHSTIQGLRGTMDGVMSAMWRAGRALALLTQFENLVQENGEWDFKNNQHFRSVFCPTSDCKNTITLCGICVMDDVPGNIHYGYIGRYASMKRDFLLDQAAQAQNGGVDPDYDVAAIEIGMDLADSGGKKSLCELVRAYANRLHYGPKDCEPCNMGYNENLEF